jgi:hypothetical protein
VQKATQKVLVDWPLTRLVAYEDMLHVFLAIRGALEHSHVALLESLLPPENTCELDGVSDDAASVWNILN